MSKTYFTEERIIKKYNKLSASKQVPILYDALDFMQQHNSRSKVRCIALAMGYKNDIGAWDTYYLSEKQENE